MRPIRIVVGLDFIQLPREIGHVPEEHAIKIFAATGPRRACDQESDHICARSNDILHCELRSYPDTGNPDQLSIGGHTNMAVRENIYVFALDTCVFRVIDTEWQPE